MIKIKVLEIKNRDKSSYELAKLYPIGRSAICNIKNGKITKGVVLCQ